MKILKILIPLVLVFSLSSCGKEDDSIKEENV
jgi:uncharacterized lipoprotein YehR (DUF1307 family)